MTKKETTLSEQALEVLSRFHDGELAATETGKASERDRVALERLRAECPLDVAAELQSMSLLRSELQSMSEEALASRTSTTWMAIENEVRVIAAEYRSAANAREAKRQAWGAAGATWWERVSEIFSPSVFSPRIAGRIAGPVFALFAVMLVAGQMSPTGFFGTASEPERFASVALTQQQMDHYSKQMAATSFAAERRPVLAVSNVAEQAYERRFLVRDENDMHVRFATSMLDRDFILGGLRTTGADIEEVSSERLVNILPSEDAGSPPIVWDANAAPAFGVSGAYARGISANDVN